MTATSTPAHLAMPLQVLGGRLGVLPQDDPAEVAQSVALLLATDVGERRSEPDYGTPDLLFRTAVDQSDIVDAIRLNEPRADQPTIEVAVAIVGGIALADVLDINVSSTVLSSRTA